MSGVDNSTPLAYMLSTGNMSTDSLGRGGVSGGCEIHMNSSFPHLAMAGGPGGPNVGIAPAGGAIPLHYGHHYGQKLPWGLNWLRPLMLCCQAHSLLSKFPSRAKRIDVISRVIFPMVFAVFNLAYWLYYLFAKSKTPSLND